ncbi:MAG: DUF3892 domain-containing protein [Candidatus Peribacteraceae bacterium]|nr:DUF3892 domain-containing protein [Candidatus Peribacteraceae bacterium]
MGNYRITCIVHDDKKVIIKVGIENENARYLVKEIVDWINRNEHTFYTLERGVKASVYAKQHSTSGRWFLTTKPDDSNENNLDFLPQCS